MKNIRMMSLAIIIILVAIPNIIMWQSSVLPRHPFSAPEASYDNWDDILDHPKPVTVQAYSTGIRHTTLSGLMNLDHAMAQDIEDEPIEIPVLVSLIQHQELGPYLVDAGQDSSFVDHPYGNMKGILIKKKLAKGYQEPNTDIAAILNRENIDIQGVFLTHLHPDHTAGILELPKDIPYVMGKGEFYPNIAFFIRGDHLAGIDELYEIDFDTGIDLPPLGKGVDVFGDGSFWAISSSGHSEGHVMYFVNGVEDQILLTGDAINIKYQFDMGIGPGTFSSDLEQGQEVMDRIQAFVEQYPEVKLSFGHDLETQ